MRVTSTVNIYDAVVGELEQAAQHCGRWKRRQSGGANRPCKDCRSGTYGCGAGTGDAERYRYTAE